MADPEQIEQELRSYLEEEKNLSKQDRLICLKAIFDKHFAMDKTEHLVNFGNLYEIMSYAKSAYPKTVIPMVISKREVSLQETNYVLVMESFITYLNKSKLLKKLVKFDFTR